MAMVSVEGVGVDREELVLRKGNRMRVEVVVGGRCNRWLLCGPKKPAKSKSRIPADYRGPAEPSCILLESKELVRDSSACDVRCGVRAYKWIVVELAAELYISEPSEPSQAFSRVFSLTISHRSISEEINADV